MTVYKKPYIAIKWLHDTWCHMTPKSQNHEAKLWLNISTMCERGRRVVRLEHLQETIYWATSLFDLAFCWAFCWPKVRSKIRLKSKIEVTSLSLSLSRNFGLRPKFWLSKRISERLRWKVRSKYRLRPKLSRTNLAEVGRICMEEIA